MSQTPFTLNSLFKYIFNLAFPDYLFKILTHPSSHSIPHCLLPVVLFLFFLALIISWHTVFIFSICLLFAVWIPSNIKQIQRGQISLHLFFSYPEQCLVYKNCSKNIYWMNEYIYSLNNSHPIISDHFLDFDCKMESHFPSWLTKSHIDGFHLPRAFHLIPHFHPQAG